MALDAVHKIEMKMDCHLDFFMDSTQGLGVLGDIGLIVGCRNKADFRHVGPGSIGECPPWGVFLRDPSPYLSEFRRKPQKTPNG